MDPNNHPYEVSFSLYANGACVKKFVMGLTMAEIEKDRLLDPACRLEFAKKVLASAGHSDGGATSCWFSLKGGKA